MDRTYTHDDTDDFVTEKVTTDVQTAEIYGHIPYRVFVVSLAGGQVANDGEAVETVTVSVVDGLEVARGTDSPEATVLDYDGEATVEIAGTEHSVSISGGTGTLDYATTQPAPATVDVQATALSDVPAESSNVRTIEVTDS
jgi:hypothetical protein